MRRDLGAEDGIQAVGAIEVYYSYGMRSLQIPLGSSLQDACFKAHDIWEDEGQKVRVRVIKWEDGVPTCVCHLPPEGEADE